VILWAAPLPYFKADVFSKMKKKKQSPNKASLVNSYEFLAETIIEYKWGGEKNPKP